MNPLDVLIVLLIVTGIILGWRSGAIPQVAGLLGAIAGGAAAILALPYLTGALSEIDPSYRPLVVLGGLVIAVVTGESIGAAIGRSAARRLGNGLLSAADRTAGAGLGIAQAILIVWLVGGLLMAGPFPRLAETAGSSTAVRTLGTVLPPPTRLAAGLGRWLDTTGLPDVFVGFEPLPAPPVDRPTDPLAQQIAAAAEASTVKVSAATCGLQSVGSGFAVGPGYVVTNAHVVAGVGARGLRVTSVGGRIHDAVVVLFDPEFDIALLRVKSLTAAPLVFASKDPTRGAIGAAVGYPGGGPSTVVPAAVSGHYAADGRDIYGESIVNCKILELRAAIDRGDSGGPLVLADGTVGGVVFAEARTSPDVGYALAATDVRARIQPGFGRTASVDTGACIH